jgi:hypothetical protein
LQDFRRGQLILTVRNEIEAAGMTVNTLERADYAPTSGSLAEVKRRISGCAGAVILGFRDITIKNGSWRDGTAEETSLDGCYFSSAWSHIEAGMAIMMGLPVLLVSEGNIRGGLFDLPASEFAVYRADPNEIRKSTDFADWCRGVREVARRSNKI